jgi:hypothetical protein
MRGRDKSAAATLWPNLPSTPEAKPRSNSSRGSIAEEIFPSLVPKPPPRPNPYREATLRHLDEVLAKLRGSQ